MVIATFLASWVLHVGANQPAKPIRLLFIGNSYTYVNNVPKLVEAIAPKGIRVQTAMIAEGGATLKDHWDSAKNREVVKTGKWDFVVLQEQSSLGQTLFVDGLVRITTGNEYVTYAKSWAKFARTCGAKPLLVEFWPYQEAPARDWAALRYWHQLAAKESQSQLVRVGEAWMKARRTLGDKVLYDDDGSHPKPIGSLISAGCILQAALGRPTNSLPEKIEVPVPKQQRSAASQSNLKFEVTDRQRQALVSAFRGGPGIPVRSLPNLDLPRVAPGGKINRRAMVGNWRGRTTLFPRFMTFPATLEINIRSEADAEIVVGFKGKPADMTFVVDRIGFDNDKLTLVAVNGPNDTYLLFIGSYEHSRLEGVAKMILPNGKPLAIGKWRVERETRK